MPRPSRTRQVMDPMTAYQVVHILEGVVQRGTATILRDLDRPLFGKTGTTTGPTNVWFVGGRRRSSRASIWATTSRALGGYAQGGTIAAPIFSQFAAAAFEGHAGRPVPSRPPASAWWDRPALGPARLRRLAEHDPARR